jgi:hypothetical protein
LLICKFLDYIVSAELSLVPSGKSYYADTYKFTTVCTATFNAIYDANESRYSNKYAAATLLAIGLLFSAYVFGGKTRRLCTGNGDTEDEKIESNFVDMNKTENEFETALTELEPSTPDSDNIENVQKRRFGKLFTALFRRKTNIDTDASRKFSSTETVDSGVSEGGDTGFHSI